MRRSNRTRVGWIVVAILVGVAYCVIGRAFAAPTSHRQAWRLAAWVVSGIVFAAQIGYDRFRLSSSPGATALHASLAAALGGFLLALVVAIRVWSASPSSRAPWLVALVAWPVLTGIPAFVVALVVALVLRPAEPSSPGLASEAGHRLPQ